MLKNNNLVTGILIALPFPAIAILVSYLLRNDVYIINKPAVPYFIAIALNLIMMRIFISKGADKLGRGVMLTNFIFMLLVFLFKFHWPK